MVVSLRRTRGRVYAKKGNLKQYVGVKNPKFYPIIRNRDRKGRILTYTVKLPHYNMEVNTLKEARIMAIKI